MSDSLNRRGFLGWAASTGVALGLAPAAGALGANDKIRVAVIGTGGRGTEHAQTFAKLAGVEVAAVCDVDEKHAGKAAEAVNQAAGKSPQALRDLRRLLDDKSIDAVVIATCNHWHAPAAILACAAGKHVYVEKPCSHNPREGELMVEAARKHRRLVQMGNQRRSWPKVIEAVQQLRDGAIGRVYLAQGWYTNTRGSIGRGKPADVPAGLDYDLWQGPAPRRPFHTNYLHYTWHWFWHWGNGELGNNGVHMIDVCRWGLGVDYPVRVTSSGGRYRFDDDQETPDTHEVAFEFDGRKTITWQGLSCNQLPAGMTADVLFTGENGCLAIRGGGYTVYDLKGKELKKVTGPDGDLTHVGNFLDAIRAGKALNSEIEEGHKSTLLCHLGNIAHRTGRTLRCNPGDGHVLDDAPAMALWTREYEKGWEPKV
jgi:predicted dehydrogenase